MEPTLARGGSARDVASRDFEALVAPCVEEMYRLAATIVGPHDARDVTQESLLTAWSKLGNLRRRDDARPWLHAIVVNQCRQLLRAQRRRPRVIDVDEPGVLDRAPATPDASRAVAERDRLDRAFGRLDADHRAALALHYVTDLTVPQIAVALGIREGTVKSRIHAAVERMRVELDRQEARG
jgi:RNA polymerase sigma-70 factor (ECF subfamily)